jgi:CheY-like chemotaxis protein
MPFGGLSPVAIDAVQPDDHNRRILLVEDHPPTCATLTQLLARRGFRVVAARSLHEARTAAEREKFDILISDIGLPDGNGCDLMVELRKRQNLRGIALTGYGMSEDMERSRQSGFATHLTKPVSVGALDHALSLMNGK